MRINIVLPYNEAKKYYERWATEENSIDFRSEKDKAVRCTISFAATELVSYLGMMEHEVSVSDEKQDCLNIFIKCLGGDSEEFDILYNGADIEIIGCGRRGSLYGVYELLEMQGVRWYSPEVEFVPKNSEFVYPESRHYKYDLPDGRGFHFEDLQNESKSFLLWMARNRMTTHACHAHSKAFQEKLCMILETGGHIFEKILNPNNITDDGRYFIDAHKDWYGQRDEEITVKNALKMQFCVSNEELLDYISNIVINKLSNEWKNEECFCLDGFDTWGRSCNCEKCKALGNGSDMTLKFMSHIRTRINEATERGELREGIKLSFCVYEGTNTMLPPENPVPQNLIDAGDFAQFSPIKRCYQHDFSYPCERNESYNSQLKGWLKTGMKISFLEYYNVSRFEDLPILFTKRIANDIPYYIKSGVTKVLYMHVFVKDWGIRALNHYLLANVSRDCNCDAELLAKEYFKNVYGKYADAAEAIYAKIEKATELSASWRSWMRGSVLTALTQGWLTPEPVGELECDSHLRGKAAKCGYETVRLLTEALDGLRDIRERAISDMSSQTVWIIETAVNPAEMLKITRKNNKFFDKINDDIRGVKYGLDVFTLMTLFVDYRDSLVEKRDDSDELIEKIKVLGEKMSEYTFSVCFNAYEPDFQIRDALVRSQLKDLYYRCLSVYNSKQK